MATKRMAAHGVPTVGQYMTSSPHWIGADHSLSEARIMMREHRIRHLPVLRGAELVGIVSERDLGLIEACPTFERRRVPVEEAMTPTPFTASPVTPLHEVARVMAERKCGSAVVVDGGAVVGVFTTTDAAEGLGRYTPRARAGAESGPDKARRSEGDPRSHASTRAGHPMKANWLHSPWGCFAMVTEIRKPPPTTSREVVRGKRGRALLMPAIQSENNRCETGMRPSESLAHWLFVRLRRLLARASMGSDLGLRESVNNVAAHRVLGATPNLAALVTDLVLEDGHSDLASGRASPRTFIDRVSPPSKSSLKYTSTV